MVAWVVDKRLVRVPKVEAAMERRKIATGSREPVSVNILCSRDLPSSDSKVATTRVCVTSIAP